MRVTPNRSIILVHMIQIHSLIRKVVNLIVYAHRILETITIINIHILITMTMIHRISNLLEESLMGVGLNRRIIKVDGLTENIAEVCQGI